MALLSKGRKSLMTTVNVKTEMTAELACKPSVIHRGNVSETAHNLNLFIKSMHTYDNKSVSVQCASNPKLSPTTLTVGLRWWLDVNGRIELVSEDQFSIDVGDAVVVTADRRDGITVVRAIPFHHDQVESSGRYDSIDEVADNIHSWANRTFPNRTSASALLKMYGEIGELVDCPQDGQEYADILILLLDLAKMNGVTSIIDALNAKMAKNMKRNWSQDSLGVYSHIGSDDDANN